VIESAKDFKSNDIYLRVAREDDLANIKRLVDKTIDISYENTYAQEALEFFKKHHALEDIREDLQQEYLVVVEINDEIIGTGTLVGNEIGRVFVNPKFQGKGLGKTIMEKLERKAVVKDIETIYLDASLFAYDFYKYLGYETISEESIDVGEGEKLDYYKMKKII
jgi:N-acetylglutamate synthase-like GNAT family acetyltransferase